ncbi:hypothetical protein J1N35_006316 [Gossypium stocksii]|uniref:Uncharacterized protein n=1 Tax=Gossypium stocksii TaxID=47602 RepID=A0A9D4AK66_9ROSI|nr:hypothetical protein J1N35_006316 [Gossypium stocksii]
MVCSLYWQHLHNLAFGSKPLTPPSQGRYLHYYERIDVEKPYTLGTYSWRQVKRGKFNSINSGDICTYTTKSFYKLIHWKGEYHDSIGFDIISFDLGDEEFRRI